MKKQHTKTAQDKKVAGLYKECKQWKSTLSFLEDDSVFIKHLLHSYVFEPNTPNLFERLSEYQNRIKKADETIALVTKKLADHEPLLGGMLDCEDDACDLEFYQKHHRINVAVVQCTNEFHQLKSAVFNYAGGILKQRKN